MQNSANCNGTFSKQIIGSLENTAWGVAHLLETLIKCFMATLLEKDIPGASLNSQDPGELKVLELKRWLAC